MSSSTNTPTATAAPVTPVTDTHAGTDTDTIPRTVFDFGVSALSSDRESRRRAVSDGSFVLLVLDAPEGLDENEGENEEKEKEKETIGIPIRKSRGRHRDRLSPIRIPAPPQTLPALYRTLDTYRFGEPMPHSRYTHAVPSASPGSFPPLHQELARYRFGTSRSGDRPVSTAVSPLTRSGASSPVDGTPVAVLSTSLDGRSSRLDGSGEDTHQGCIDELTDIISEEAFPVAAFEFFSRLSFDALHSSYILEDHDDLKGEPGIFNLAPHAWHPRCWCYFCGETARARVYGYGVHDYSAWCACDSCQRLGWRELYGGRGRRGVESVGRRLERELEEYAAEMEMEREEIERDARRLEEGVVRDARDTRWVGGEVLFDRERQMERERDGLRSAGRRFRLQLLADESPEDQTMGSGSGVGPRPGPAPEPRPGAAPGPGALGSLFDFVRTLLRDG